MWRSFAPESPTQQGHGRCFNHRMITIALVAYVGTTVLFVAGLAAAAGRPVPEVDYVIELPLNITAKGESSLEKAA
jgi:hypothetical protein